MKHTGITNIQLLNPELTIQIVQVDTTNET